MKTAVATFFYPKAINYTSGFLKCITSQSNRNFTLIVFNDGVNDIQNYFTDYADSILFVEVSGTPTQVRFQSFEYLSKADFEHIIFQDMDDEMSTNRVEVVSNLLKTYSIVSNDLSLVNDKGIVYAKSIWSDRLKDLFEFDYSYIKDKNIVGIGNSGIRRNTLTTKIGYSSLPKVADWFMFYQLMLQGNIKAVFTTQCQTLYRQHEDNMAGVKKIDKARLDYIIQVKKAHYLGLQEVGFNVSKELNDLTKIESSIQYITTINSIQENQFWWDETNQLISN